MEDDDDEIDQDAVRKLKASVTPNRRSEPLPVEEEEVEIINSLQSLSASGRSSALLYNSQR